MQPGEMKSKINILTVSNADGPFGSKKEIFKENIWAKKEQLVGDKLIQAMGEGRRIPCNFIIRRNDNVTTDMLVECDSKKYEIVSAVPLNKMTQYTILTCFEVI